MIYIDIYIYEDELTLYTLRYSSNGMEMLTQLEKHIYEKFIMLAYI